MKILITTLILNFSLVACASFDWPYLEFNWYKEINVDTLEPAPMRTGIPQSKLKACLEYRDVVSLRKVRNALGKKWVNIYFHKYRKAENYLLVKDFMASGESQGKYDSPLKPNDFKYCLKTRDIKALKVMRDGR